VFAQIMTILAFQASFVLIPYYIQQMGITDVREVSAWTGAYQSAGAIAFAVFTPIWGALGDRYGRKIMLVRAMASTAVIMALMGFARTPTQLLALRILQGCVTGTPAAASALIATGSPKNRLAYALGLLQTAFFVGASLGPMLGGHIADSYSYRATFFVSAFIVLIAFFTTLTIVREPEESAAANAQARMESPITGFRMLLASRTMLPLIFMGFAVNMTFSLTGPVFPILVQELVADPQRLASTAGTISGAAALAAAVSAMVVGRISDRVGHRRALVSCSLGTALVYLPQALARSPLMLGSMLGLQGLFRGGIAPNISAMVVRNAPRDKIGAAMGLNSSAASAGFAVGPMLGAALLAATSTRTVFVITGGIFMLVTLVVWVITAHHPEGQEQSEAIIAPAA
jgi:DHA1 family multidrug resistance protein-like MFS transporter